MSRPSATAIEPATERVLLRAQAEYTAQDLSPFSYFDSAHFAHTLRNRAGAAAAQGLELAYSLKTNPSTAVLDVAFREGVLIETINALETATAVSRGWAPSQVILNGPVKTWPGQRLPAELLAVFADTIAEFSELAVAADGCAMFSGLRLRPHGVPSRFGVRLDDSTLDATLSIIRELARRGRQVACSMHISSAHIGITAWRRLVHEFVEQCNELARLSRASIALVDVGGGWTESDLEGLLMRSAGFDLHALVRTRLGADARVVLEPGRSVVSGSGVLLTRVARKEDDMSAVVDASIAELPFPTPARPVYRFLPHVGWQRLAVGAACLYGRSCMESDIVAKDVELSSVSRGDLLAFGDTGGYDTSMSFTFGRGGTALAAHPVATRA